jgi:hypothetical protein
MKYFLTGAFLLVLLSCGAPPKPKSPIVENDPKEEIIKKTNTIIMTNIPEDAVSGNFELNTAPFYAAVEVVDIENQTTTISFENEEIAKITIPEAVGASLSSVRFDQFDQDVLVVNTIYTDPIFRKYYLYILKDTQWMPVVDGFILHVENISEEHLPIKIHPTRSHQMIRSYSVFDMDPESDTKYSWILHEETTDILNR